MFAIGILDFNMIEITTRSFQYVQLILVFTKSFFLTFNREYNIFTSLY